MATVLITKFSSTTSSAPITADLAEGELAVNTVDGTLYVGTGTGVTQISGVVLADHEARITALEP